MKSVGRNTVPQNVPQNVPKSVPKNVPKSIQKNVRKNVSKSVDNNVDEIVAALVRTSRRLSRAVDAMKFGGAVATVYNPLAYAREPHEMYLALARPRPTALFLGMNPGPFGMAQTGVPFGEVAAVREFLKIEARVKQPRMEHPKRKIEGFDCARSEVSGRRFWGFMATEFGTRDAFFRRAFVWNWCPLAFMTDSGANLTPDKLPRAEQEEVATACDAALYAMVATLEPAMIIGVGAFASERAARALGDGAPPIATVLHPSPASPAANRGWDAAALKQLTACGFLPSTQ